MQNWRRYGGEESGEARNRFDVSEAVLQGWLVARFGQAWPAVTQDNKSSERMKWRDDKGIEERDKWLKRLLCLLASGVDEMGPCCSQSWSGSFLLQSS